MSNVTTRHNHRGYMGIVWILRASLISIRACPRACIEQIEADWGWRRIESGVYFLWRGPELTYIGRSKNLRKRFHQHLKEGWPMGRPDSITMLRAPVPNAKLIEATLIERFRPRGNKATYPAVILRRRWALMFPYRLLSGLPVFEYQ